MAAATLNTDRLQTKKKMDLSDAYSEPANFLEIEGNVFFLLDFDKYSLVLYLVCDAQTHGFGRKRFSDYEVKMKTNLPVFRLKHSSVRRRYSDFEWLRAELERDSKVI